MYQDLIYPFDISLPDKNRDELLDYLKTFRLDNDPHNELDAYLKEDFNRFLYTLSLVPDETGNLLEIGSNPYFTTILLKKYRQYNLFLTNFFGNTIDDKQIYTQTMSSNEFKEEFQFQFMNSNIEDSDIPYSQQFDVILFCEVIEHLINDPMSALLRIKNSLKKGGYLILTTPNVNRLENVARMIAGANIYDPFSGHGLYGRHNREYNKHELFTLLNHLGFEVEIIVSSDVHDNYSRNYFDIDNIYNFLEFRKHDLGQYIFIRAKNTGQANIKKPKWLYRSYTINELD